MARQAWAKRLGLGEELLVVSDESIMEDGKDAPKLLWMVDARDETGKRVSMRPAFFEVVKGCTRK